MKEGEEIDPLDAYMATLETPSQVQIEDNVPHIANSKDQQVFSRRRRSRGSNETVVKNRRFRRLQQLLQPLNENEQEAPKEANSQAEDRKGATKEGWYFSDENMNMRNPALYHFYVGQYLTEPERQAAKTTPPSIATSSLSCFLMETCDRQVMEIRRKHEQDTWGCRETIERQEEARREEERKQHVRKEGNDETFQEEFDSSDEENEQVQGEPMDEQLSIDERRQYLIDLMSQRFLQGLDTGDIDYTRVDGNELLDDYDLIQRDAEDRYFASDN